MTIAEFKAFLDGMDIQGTPTESQWARIAEKIAVLEPFRVSGPSYTPPTYTPSIPNWPYEITCGSTAPLKECSSA